MKQGITISVLDIDKGDDLIKYKISLSNEITSTSLEFYGYADDFKIFAKELLVFPKTINDVVIFEIGEDNEIWAYYLLLKVFCYEMNGYSAIQIKMDDHRKVPESNKVEFYIKTVPASLNQLGKILNDWNPETEKEIVW